MDALDTAIRRVQKRVDIDGRRVTEAGRTNVLSSLTGADYLSLVALFFGWTSALLFLRGEPNVALIVMFVAFLFDKLDGYYARRAGVSSPFGRQVDSFIDVFAYLVPAALLYHVTMAPHPVVGAVVGFVILALGGLRLVRHNAEGFGSEGDESYYHGTTVVHTNVVCVANYFLFTLVGPWNGWAAGVAVLLAAPLMVSDYKAYKNDKSHLLAGAVALLASGLAVLLELGYV
jgi:CDP-diacylglycerol--serine O-phosphatidyltransferase